MNKVIASGHVPLPILNKIKEKFLFLQDYQISDGNFNILVEEMPAFIPNSLNKIVFMNNRLSDAAVSKFLLMLSHESSGPKVVGLIHNMAGPLTMQAMSEYMKSDASNNISKLIIKDPIFPNNKQPHGQAQLMKNLVDNAMNAFRLRELVL